MTKSGPVDPQGSTGLRRFWKESRKVQFLRKNNPVARKGPRARIRPASAWIALIRRTALGMALVGWILAMPATAFAAEPEPGRAAPEGLAAPAVGEDFLFEGLVAVEVTELEAARGGERTVLNLEDMMGQVEGNSIEGTVTTGAATVSGGSFHDFNGVSSVIINSGNNVSIQSSTTVNIVIDGN